jgi:hypothetical protein
VTLWTYISAHVIYRKTISIIRKFNRSGEISDVYKGGAIGLHPPPRNVLKNLKIILNVFYILTVLYAYLEFASNVKSFWDIL